jgi:hypothetical protein
MTTSGQMGINTGQFPSAAWPSRAQRRPSQAPLVVSMDGDTLLPADSRPLTQRINRQVDVGSRTLTP